MSKRYTQRMDIFFPDTNQARQFGKKQVTVALLAS
jgi:3D (Asp-Asp-Asp) domain-containing protein